MAAHTIAQPRLYALYELSRCFMLPPSVAAVGRLPHVPWRHVVCPFTAREAETEPPGVTLSTSHMPAAACPGTAQTIAYVPTFVAVKVNVWRTPRPTPVVAFGVV